ncbi:hypothetical protein BH09MYX1_BH09MYX1_18910 [soil metagenome]
MIDWTEEARKNLLPRDLTGAVAPRLPKPEKAWTEIKARFKPRPNYDPIEANFVTHRGQATAENARLMEAGEKIVRAETAPEIPNDVDVAAGLLTSIGYLATRRQMADYFALKRGFPFAFHVALRSRDFAMGRPQHLIAAAPDQRGFDGEWRTMLRGLSPELRAECKEIAKPFWERGSLAQRTTIAYVFFEEHAWGDAIAAQWLPQKNRMLEYLYPIVHDFELAKQLVRGRENARSFLELVETFGDEMLPVLLEVGAAPTNPFDLKYAAEALSLFDDDRVASWLAALVAKTKVRPYVQSYFALHPDRAEAAFAPIAKGKTKTAKVAAEFLASATRAAASATSVSDEATAAEVPKILADPPWEQEGRPKRPTTKLTLDPILVPERLGWREGEREKCLGRLRASHSGRAAASPEQIDEFRKSLTQHKTASPWLFRNAILPAEVTLEVWNSGQAQMDGGTRVIGHMMARFGEEAMPGMVHYVTTHFGNSWGDAKELLVVDSPRIALGVALLLGNKRRGVIAWQWLEKNAGSAVLGLVPLAFGRDEAARAAAESALLRLSMSGVDVKALAASYGKDAAKALDKLFEWDPIYDCPKKTLVLGPSWRPETFTRPKLKNGKALPLSAVTRIGEMLAFTPLDPPYAGIARLFDACEERSLAELSWDLARAWEHGGAKAKEKWMLMSLIHLADETVTRRMTPGIRTDYAVQALEIMATDAALMELATIAGRQNAQGEWSLAGRIEVILDTAASLRGVTKDELEEDLAPTTELDADASLTLEYGSRTLRVGFDEHLAPYVRGENGERLRGVPPARKDDDAEAIERAKVVWRDLKEDMTVIGLRRVRALERATAAKRTWTRERFVRVWQEDRLVKHLARGVVWATDHTRFRIAEDGSLADMKDEPFALSDSDLIHVPHPLRMAERELAAWRTIFEDYEIVQPFAQLGRALPDVTNLAATSMPWTTPIATTADITNRLNRRGFRWSGGGGKVAYRKSLPTRGELSVSYTMVNNVPSEVAINFEVDNKAVTLGEVEPIEVAEALFDLFSDAPT